MAGTSVVLVAVAGVAVVAAVVFLVLWLAAVRRSRRTRRQDRAADTAVSALELSVADQSGRLRIIRELHDVAVHRVATIVTRAESARYAGATDPTAAVRAAEEIGRLGHAVLADLRRVMTLVRESEEAAVPASRTVAMRDLFDVLREAGLVIEFEQTGTSFELNRGAEIAVYRILQEALSNALQYGGEGTAVRVALTWTDDGLALRVDDTGLRNRVEQRVPDPAAARAELAYGVDDDLRALTQEITGPGVTEMRTRAELYGGVLDVHEVPGVGYSVSVSFPTMRFHNGVHGVDLTR